MAQIVVPFLKWAGGKRWLAPEIAKKIPETKGQHIEPFAGSAALFFYRMPERAILSDLNAKLIDTYAAIRDNHNLFSRHLKAFARTHSKDNYYSVREKQFRSRFKSAAQFVYLNRVCFNGIYRENLKGAFNVPIGSKEKVLLKSDNFSNVSKLLRKSNIIHSDFEAIVDMSQHGDFLYVDPPYTTRHNLNGFVKYNQKIFSWEDQERLAEAVIRAHSRGVKIVVSNADHADVRDLYTGFLDVHRIERQNVIASMASKRGKVTELLATNVF